MTRCLVLRYDGRAEHLDANGTTAMAAAIGADYLDIVNLRDVGLSIAVDDLGLYRRLPVNHAATAMLHATGRILAHPLVGDVVVFGLDPNTGETLDAPADLLLAALD